ncbi:unnamed protein product [Danaus chrysippus]|uniref:(African queen) hypothetical protein n=1 Tax=Danaus chrysippus TaxID=151541 RepID=A0A8J2W505_9NEOP|nr:unnamed protein product [Danaus chrysippus]
MSETDDTDVLLLIPPTFFLVNSSCSEDSFLESSRTVVHKPVSCTAKVIGKLVDQVQSLESRLETLEIDTSNTFSSLGSRKVWDTESFESRSRSLDRRCFTFPRRKRRKTRKERNGSHVNLDITHEKHPVYRQILDHKAVQLSLNESQSMDGDLSSITSTPSKKTDKLLLHEIDEFLTKVESYQTPDNRARDSTISSENVIQATGEYIMKSLGSKNIEDIQLPSGRVVSSNILDKYIYLVKNKQTQSNASTSAQNDSDTQNFSSATTRNEVANQNCASTNIKHDTRSPSMRKLNFYENKDVQPTSTPKKNTHPRYCDTFKPSSNKILERASKVLDNYRSQSFSRNTQSVTTETSDMSFKKDDFKLPQMKPFCLDREGFKIDSIETDLLSLSELWGEKADKNEKFDNNKLEEERLKREHCEVMIQQLQKKLLEQQEKLAVAVKVDRAKDAAIHKLREAWLRLTGNLDQAEERHRNALDEMNREVDNFKMVADEAQKKTNHFETELYKALDLAHDYQEQCKLLTTEKKDLQESLQSLQAQSIETMKVKEKEMAIIKENCETLMRLNKQSADCVENLEVALAKEKSDHEKTKNKIIELIEKMNRIEQEKKVFEQESEAARERINQEKERCNMIETELLTVKEQCVEIQRKYDAVQSEAKSLQEQLEVERKELKRHYQAQLEEAVVRKLREFQEQLELAERDMERAAREGERAAGQRAERTVAAIREQHKLEVNVLEEKQKEEIKLYRLQLAQAQEKIGLLESKLSSYRRGRGELAAQLHGVMQAQWKQALTILTRQHASHYRDDVPTPVSKDFPLPPPLSPPNKEHSGNMSDHELQQYIKLLLSKPPGHTAEPHKPDEEPTRERRDRGRIPTPVSKDFPLPPPLSPPNKEHSGNMNDHELQQYIQLLLSKPGHTAEPHKPDEEPTHERRDRG